MLVISTANDLSNGNFGYIVAPSMYGNLWNDIDGDGVQRAGGGALGGWTVQIYTGASLVTSTTTDTAGNYRFVNLAASTTYTVRYVTPSGQTWTETFESDGAMDNGISTAAVAGVASGSHDFALRQTGTASIGDSVYFDVDHNAVRDATDEGIPGVPVKLYRDSDANGSLNLTLDAVVATTVTATDGTYLFDTLPPETYFVVVDTSAAAVLATSATADPNETGVCVTCDGRSGAITLAAGATNLAQDFGFDPVGNGSIGDLVWFDRDGDGVRDLGEPGIASVTVTLQADLNADGSYVTYATTATDSLGAYSFTNLPNGNFRVEVDIADTEIPTDGFGVSGVATTPTSRDVAVTGGSVTVSADFGFANLGAIGNAVFADADANGTQDWNEAGIPGVTVQVWADPEDDGSYILHGTTVTDPSGFYSFSGLQPGMYRIVVVESSLPWLTVTRTADPDRDGVACADSTYPSLPSCDAVQSKISVGFGTTYMGADFGYQPPGALGDFVWLDGDHNGKQDQGEPGIASVAVRLYSDTDGNGVGDVLLATTTTDPDGRYSFADKADGNYVIVVDQTTFTTTMAATVGPDSIGSNTAAVTVSGGVAHLDLDFGYRLVGTASVSGSVCLEDTGATNGVCEGSATDQALAGIIITLSDNTASVVGSTVTDSNGAYSFTGIPAGTYTVSTGMTAAPLSLADTTSPSVTETATSAFRTFSVTGSTGGIDLPFKLVAEVDLGDLPAPYRTALSNGAYHQISTLKLGSAVDGELVSAASAAATGDDVTATDDEDGIVFNPATWTPDALADGDDGSITATVSGGSGYLLGWIDWDGNGSFTGPNEMIVSQAVTAGSVNVGFDIPSGTVLTAVHYARFRLFAAAPPIPALAYVGPAVGGEVEDYAIAAPEVDVSKTLTAGPTLQGDGTYSVTYHVTVTNAGATPLHDVQVTDDLAAGFGTYTSATPESGEYTVASTAIVSTSPDPLASPLTLATFTGAAPADGLFDVSAGGSLGAGEAITVEIVVVARGDATSGCRRSCAVANSVSTSADLDVNNDGIVNGDATATDGPVTFELGSVAGAVQADTDKSGTVDSPLPGVTVRLYAAVDPGLLFDDLVAATTTNSSGQFHFANVVPGSYQIVELQPSGYASLSESDGVIDDRINVAVSAAAQSSGHEFGEQAGASPVITVVKSGPASATVGQTVTYTFAVSHAPTSDGSAVRGLTVTDNIAGAATYVSGDANSDLLLDAGETWNYSATYTIVAADADPLINTGTVTGTDRDGKTISDTDTHTLNIGFAPVITVVKSGPASATVGQTVTYTFAVSHAPTSDGSAVRGLTVTDNIAGAATYVSGDANSDLLLDAGETWNYSASYTVLTADPDPLINIATATGKDRDGNDVSDTDTHTLNIGFAPAIAVVKSGPASATVGQTVTYTFAVSHAPTSDGSAVRGLTVTDNIAGAATYVSGDTDSDLTLDAGETWNYSATYTIVATDPDPLINTATVTGTDRDGKTISDTDTHSTDLFAHVLSIDDTYVTPSGTTVVASVGDNDSTSTGTFTLLGPLPDATTVGLLTFHDDGTFTFVPAPSFVGRTSFPYRLCVPGPSERLCDDAIVTITVGPKAKNDSVSTPPNTPIGIHVLDNDQFARGRSASIRSL